MTITERTQHAVAARVSPFDRRRFAVAVLVAAVMNAAVYTIGRGFGGSMIVTSPNSLEISVLVVLVATIVPLTLAGVATWFIARRRPGIRRWAAWIGAAVAILSAPSPLLVAADPATGIALAVMHVVAGIAWFIALTGRRGVANAAASTSR